MNTSVSQKSPTSSPCTRITLTDDYLKAKCSTSQKGWPAGHPLTNRAIYLGRQRANVRSRRETLRGDIENRSHSDCTTSPNSVRQLGG